DEHLHLQHRGQLGLTRGAFEKAAAENTEADGRAERAHAENDAYGEHRHGVNVCEIFHSTLLNETCTKLVFSVVLVRHRQVDDRQHHEYEGLQCDHKQVEHSPNESQQELDHQESPPARVLQLVKAMQRQH